MWATGMITLPATTTEPGVVLRGMRLERDPFLSLLQEYAIAAPTPALTNAVHAAVPPSTIDDSAEHRLPGGKRQWKDWDRVWSALLKLALDERLNRAEFPSQAKLMEEIRSIEKDDIFSDRILKRFLSPVYKEFVQPRN